jgi:competence protein CoiA
MKFALVGGQRLEARPGPSGTCQGCGSSVVAKCGEVRIWHWAHQTKRACDVWWENEGQWHRNWKSHFPANWQEVIHRAADGARHIADVKTPQGWVIELQHSQIAPEERRSRDAFYGKLVWVVDASRRKRDASQFVKALESAALVGGNPYIRRVVKSECRLIQEWSGSSGPVFFDFGDPQTLWWLLAKEPNGAAYLGLFMRNDFIRSHHGEGPELARNFDKFLATYTELVALSEAFIRSQSLGRVAASPPNGLTPYLSRQPRRHRRL